MKLFPVNGLTVATPTPVIVVVKAPGRGVVMVKLGNMPLTVVEPTPVRVGETILIVVEFVVVLVDTECGALIE